MGVTCNGFASIFHDGFDDVHIPIGIIFQQIINNWTAYYYWTQIWISWFFFFIATIKMVEDVDRWRLEVLSRLCDENEKCGWGIWKTSKHKPVDVMIVFAALNGSNSRKSELKREQYADLLSGRTFRIPNIAQKAKTIWLMELWKKKNESKISNESNDIVIFWLENKQFRVLLRCGVPQGSS